MTAKKAPSIIPIAAIVALCFLPVGLWGQTYALTPMPKAQFFDASGNPCVGCKLYSFTAGTATPLATYTDSTGLTPNTNPVVLDSAGRANIWLSANTYKLTLTTADGTQVWSVDGVAASNGGIALQLSSPPPIGNVTPNIISATTFTADSVTAKVIGKTVQVAQQVGANASDQLTAAVTAACANSAPAISLQGMTYTAVSATVTLGCSGGKPLYVDFSGSPILTPSSDIDMFRWLPSAIATNGQLRVDVTGVSGYSHAVLQLSNATYENQPGDSSIVQSATVVPSLYVEGGQNSTGTALYLSASSPTTSYIQFVWFKPIVVMGMQNCIWAHAQGDGWINANHFEKVQCTNSVNDLNVELVDSATHSSAFWHNTFDEFESEYAASSFLSQGVEGVWTHGVGIYEGNQFLSTSFWDWSCSPPACYTINIANTGTASNNPMVGQLELGKANYTDGSLWGSWDSRTGYIVGNIINPTGSATFPYYNASTAATGYELGGHSVLSGDGTNTTLFPMDTAGTTYLKNFGNTSSAGLDQHGSFLVNSAVTTQNASGAESSTITSGNLFNGYHNTSTFTGNGIYLDLANGSGTFSGNFFDFRNNTVSKASMDSGGNLTINNLAAAQITSSTMAGTGSRCVHVDDSGVMTATASDCGAGGGGSVTGVGAVAPVASTGGTGPNISLQNSAAANVTAAYGTDTAYFTASGGAATASDFILGDAQGGIKDGGFSTIGNTIGGTGQNSSAWTGYPKVNSGTWSALTGTYGQIASYNSSGVPAAVSGLPTYTPHQLGLAADGTDEGAALQTALTTLAGAGGGVIQLQAGDHLNAGTTVLTWPAQVMLVGTGAEGSGQWGTYAPASSYLQLGCTDTLGCIYASSYGTVMMRDLALRNTTTCSPFIYQSWSVLQMDNISFTGSAGSNTTADACNDGIIMGKNQLTCPSGSDCYFIGYSSHYHNLYMNKIRRAMVMNTATAFTDTIIYGSTTSSNSTANASLITGTCNDAGNKCGIGLLTCNTGDSVTLNFATPSGGIGAVAVVKCSGTNAIANGTRFNSITTYGAGYTSAPTTATASCTAPVVCSGGAVAVSTLVRGPFIDIQGNSSGSANALENYGRVYAEFGNAGNHTNPGDLHYGEIIYSNYGTQNHWIVTGDDDGDTPYNAIGLFHVNGSNSQKNVFECQYYQYAGSAATSCYRNASGGSYPDIVIDVPQNTVTSRYLHGVYLGDDTHPFNYGNVAVSLRAGSGNTDMAGTKSASGSAMSYTFTGTYANTPVCIMQDNTNPGGIATKTVTNTGISVSTSGLTDSVSWICMFKG